MIQPRILLVEDESNLRLTLTDLLKNEGYAVESQADGLKGQELALKRGFDLIILDVMLPSRNGFEICRDLRLKGISAPILLLTARNEVSDKLLGFKAGGDDYLTKPFDTRELKVRIEALLRRGAASRSSQIESYEFENIRVDFVKSRLTRGRTTVVLGERECRLLRYLIEHRGSVLSRDELLQEVWGYKASPLTRTVDVHIRWLRQKIEDDPQNPQYILTVHGQGYRFAG
jgi:DNA-binding response OmpR family regulator